MKEKKAHYIPIVLVAKYYILEGNYKCYLLYPNIKWTVYYAHHYSGGKSTLEMKVMGILRSTCEVTGILN